MVTTDSIRCDIPSGKAELASLRAVKVGDVRKGSLFPAIPVDVEWTCTKADTFEWAFDGTFIGLPVASVDIVMITNTLVLTVTP